jgi:hypothetical protein
MPIAIPFDEDGKQVLVPTVAPDGSALSDEAAVEQYKTTGKHYGKFDTPANAQAYADQMAAAAPPADTTVSAPAAAPGTPVPAAAALVPGAAAVPPAGPAGPQPAIQPIPTGQPPALGQTPPPAPNRSGLPMPDEIWRRIQADPTLTNDVQRAQAFAHAETIYRTQEAALAQQDRLATQAAQQQLRAAENAIYADVYSANPKITPQQIAVAPQFDGFPERRKNMIELINNPPGSGIPAAQSYAAAQPLIDRIRLPYGDPNRITSEGQIYDQMRSLNRGDLEFVLKKFNDIRSPGGEKFAQREKQFVEGVKAQIDHSNPLMGKIDQTGRQQLYEFEWNLDQKIEEYRKANKDPNALFDPASPDYMGKPERLQPYQKTLQQSTKDLARKYVTPGPVVPKAEPPPTFVGPPGSTVLPNGISIPLPAPGIVPRLPSETPADYLRRTGRPSAPAPAATALPSN